MKWKLEEEDTHVMVRPLMVRMDSSVAPELKAFVAELSEERKKLIVLDLYNIEFMDSSGLGALVGCYKLTQSVGGIRLCNIQKQVKEIFNLTHMDRIFDVNDDLEMCVEKLAA